MKTAICSVFVFGIVVGVVASTFRITNKTGGWDIHEVYISGSESFSCGNDLLGTDILEEECTRDFSINPGIYDIMLVDEDGDMYEKNDVFIVFRHEWNVTLDDLTTYCSAASGG